MCFCGKELFSRCSAQNEPNLPRRTAGQSRYPFVRPFAILRIFRSGRRKSSQKRSKIKLGVAVPKLYELAEVLA